MEVTIRAAKMDDYDALSEVLTEVDKLHVDALPHLFRRTEGPVRGRDYITELIDNEDSIILVAELDKELVGVLTAVIRTAPPYPMFVPRVWADIQDISVRSGYRRQGIGRALMDAAYAWARRHGVVDVELTVWEFNDEARAFYEELGYKTLRRHMWYTLE